MSMRRKRIKVSFQMDTHDCAAACLDMMARYHGLELTREEIRNVCNQNSQGVSLSGLTRAASALGFDTTCVKATYDEVKARVQLPLIVYWSQGHYVVLEQFAQNGVKLVDPAAGKLHYSRREFEELWLTKEGVVPRGIIIRMAPRAGFLLPTQTESSRWRFAFLNTCFGLLIKVLPGILFSVAMLMGIQFIAPFINTVIVDDGIQRGVTKVVLYFSVIQLVFVAIQAGLQALQAWLLLHVGVHINVTLADSFITKLFKVRASFFEGRQVGDLIQRFGDQTLIQQAVSVQLIEWLQGLVTVAVFAAVLYLLDGRLLLAYGTIVIVFVVTTMFVLDKQRIQNYKVFRASSQKQSAVLDLFETMTDIRLSSAEDDRRKIFLDTYQLLAKASLRSDGLTVLQRCSSFVIFEGAAVLMLYMVSHRAVQLGLTIGIVVATQYVIGQLAQPIMHLSVLASQWQAAKLSLDRSQEIHGIENEHSGHVVPVEQGDLSLKDVSFAYRGGPDVLSEVSCVIKRGQTTAIVGKSGSGKSTLLRLLLKLDTPISGEISVGGSSLTNISTNWWRQECAVVTQKGSLLADSLGINISLGRRLDPERLRAAAAMAQILEFVDSLPLQFETRVGRDGVGLSGGQLQRVLLARAFYKDANVLLLDEATSALDTESERCLVDAIKAAGKNKTCLIIAHRLSTVKEADHIIVLDRGRVVEEGTHRNLLERNGHYMNLVRHQLHSWELSASLPA